MHVDCRDYRFINKLSAQYIGIASIDDLHSTTAFIKMRFIRVYIYTKLIYIVT